jgi:dihydroflavonol-4-reductase
MKVAVTGGTGFVGSHTVAALIAAGHQVRLLARDPARIPAAFEPLGGTTPTDIVLGDVTDPSTIERLLEGCDAVVHAASIYSLDTRDAARIRATNVEGTRLIIEAARRLNLDPIVHVSSVVAIIPSNVPVDQDSPVANSAGVYGQSKADSERLARQHQAEGAPVVTVMPGSVWGPHDPHFGESCRVAADFLRGQTRTIPAEAWLAIVDVRDVAATILGTIEPGRGPRRYAVAPHYSLLRDVFDSLNRLTQRKVRYLTLPNPIIAASITPVGHLQRILPFRLPVPAEGIRTSMAWPPVDSSAAANDFAINWIPLDQTIADTITTMVERGQLPSKYAGRLAG